MKRLPALILALCLLVLCGCTGAPAETTASTGAAEPSTEAAEPSTEAAEAPTEAPTEATEPPTEATEPPPQYRNPLTGEAMEAPLENRLFAVSINNIPPAIPHYGVAQADLFFEMFVNDGATRGLAFYSDISAVGAIGSVRSMRYNFTDLGLAYDAIVTYCGGSNEVLRDMRSSGIATISAEMEGSGYYFRDMDRNDRGYAWEHCLFITGAETRAYAERKGYSVTQDPDKDYGLRFAEDATPAGGESATTVSIEMIFGYAHKNTTMVYDPECGEYIYHQYGQKMVDGITGEDTTFKNVIVILCPVYGQGVYHVADLVGSGEGYLAVNGKIIPILWQQTAQTEPITFTHPDGTPLELGIGSSYICLAPLASEVTWE